MSRDQDLLWMLAEECSNKEIAGFLEHQPKNRQTAPAHAVFCKCCLRQKRSPIPGLTAERHGTEEPQPAAAAAVPKRKAIGCGLPCSHCHAYYHADMHVCPICKSKERVSPNSLPALSLVPAMRTPETFIPYVVSGAQPR